MVRPESTLDYQPVAPTATDARRPARIAAFLLLTATVFWGCGFTWAKTAGAAVNEQMNLPHGSPLGPIWLLSCRFAIGGALWMVIFPASRRGWTLAGVGRAA